MKTTLCILLCLILSAAVLCGCSNDPYNNTTPKNELITKIYPESICEQIQYRISVGGLHIDNLREIVDVECLRKTETGSYAVLKLDNKKFAYIVIDKNNHCQAIYQFREAFHTRAELEDILETVTYYREVDAFSPNVMYSAFSFARVVVYPVKEGYIVAIFMYDPPNAGDEVLKSMEFYEDITDSSVWGSHGVFQILDIDRAE